MCKNNSRDSRFLKVSNPLQNYNALRGDLPAIGYYSYTQRQPVQKPPLLVELFGGESKQVLKYENLKEFILVFTQTLVVAHFMSYLPNKMINIINIPNWEILDFFHIFVL